MFPTPLIDMPIEFMLAPLIEKLIVIFHYSPLIVLTIFAFGLLFGSFLNVCISRLPQHESVIKPRSFCPNCKAPIFWYDNIPLLSFYLLRGNCRKCHAKISRRYPLVELLVGAWFSIAFLDFFAVRVTVIEGAAIFVIPWLQRQIIEGLGIFILGFLLIGLLVMDWQTHTLPNAFTLTGTAIGFLLTCAQALFLAPGEGDIHIHPRNNLRMSSPGSMAVQGDVFMTGAESLVLGRLGAIIAAAGIILLIRFLYKKIRRQEGLGLGDAKLMAMLAAFLGFWPAMLSLFIGVVLCSLYAVTLLARKRATGLTRLPLGSFLCIGGLFTALFGIPLIEWYKSLL